MYYIATKKYIFYLFCIFFTSSFCLANTTSFNDNKDLSFVFIVPSYNNEDWCENNLYSILNQEYENYRVIYVNDRSSDKTAEKIRKILDNHPNAKKVTFIDNKIRKGAIANQYAAIHSCKDHEIIVMVDGDDWLAHENVLNKLSDIYKDKNTWMTYGQFKYYPSGEKGFCSPFSKKELLERNFRKYKWNASHLKTFYAGLFKKIATNDFFYDGEWLDMAGDAAFMYPMLEMAANHVVFVPDILHVYNRANVLNDDKVNILRQCKLGSYITLQPKYPLLKEPPYLKKETYLKSDLIVFSYNRPLQLFAFLESLAKHVKNLNNISVLYRSDANVYTDGYKIVEDAFPKIQFIKQGRNPYKDFKPCFINTAFNEKKSASPYILFAVDDIIVKEDIDIKECIKSLEETKAYGFYLRLGKNINYCYMTSKKQKVPFLNTLSNGINAWLFYKGSDDWDYPNNVDMTLYKKTEIQPLLKKLKFYNPNTLEYAWSKYANHKKMGLCFDHSKIVNIPMNLVNKSHNRNMHYLSVEELEKIFLKGWKINIDEFYQLNNHSPHYEMEPKFIQRIQ